MRGRMPAHQLSSLGNKRRCQAFSMTSHPTATFQHGVQPGAGEGGPGGAEARCDRKPRLVSPQILAAHHYRTDRSPQTDGTHQRGDWTRYVYSNPPLAATARRVAFPYAHKNADACKFSSPTSPPRMLHWHHCSVYVILSTLYWPRMRHLAVLHHQHHLTPLGAL